MKIHSSNGFIYLGASIGTMFDLPIVTYLTGIFCVVSLYKLSKMKFATMKFTYSYTLLLVAFYIFALYVTISK